MDDLTGKISELLQNPAIASLLSQFGAPQGETPEAQPESAPPAPPPSVPQASAQGNPLSGLGLDGDMLQTVMKLAPLLSSLNQEDDSTRFLHALRPNAQQRTPDQAGPGVKNLAAHADAPSPAQPRHPLAPAESPRLPRPLSRRTEMGRPTRRPFPVGLSSVCQACIPKGQPAREPSGGQSPFYALDSCGPSPQGASCAACETAPRPLEVVRWRSATAK